jgi:hypothetical protein
VNKKVFVCAAMQIDFSARAKATKDVACGTNALSIRIALLKRQLVLSYQRDLLYGTLHFHQCII